MTPFVPGSPSHLAVPFVMALLLGILLLTQSRLLEQILAAALVIQWPAITLWRWHSGTLHGDNSLPLHLCDLTAFAAAIALWRRHPLSAEITYFFGLMGTLQGLITPNLKVGFPSPDYFAFFLLHGGIVCAAIYLVLGPGPRPRAGAAWRMTQLIVAYALVVGALNYLLGTNYAFLCAKPAAASLMDALGPWPAYLFSLTALAAMGFWLLGLPFSKSK
jgi:hypothetical integral membrane protein (TIGR02206 family)